MTFQESVAALHNDRRNVALIDISTTFAVLAGAIYILTRHWGPWSYALAFALIGLMQYRIVVACHEAVHKTLLFPLWLNETVGSIHCAFVGINLFWYRRQHLGHHAAKDLGHDTDAYIYEPILRARPGFRRLAVWIFGTAGEVLQKIYQKGFAAGVAGVIDVDWTPRLYVAMIAAAQAFLFLAFALWLSWWYYFAFWLAPLLTIGVFLNRTRVLIEHGYPHVLRAGGAALSAAPVETINLSAGVLGRFFLAPFEFNYHLSHHLAPSIPHYNNAAISLLLERNGKVPSASRPSYAQALRRILWT